MTEKAKKVSSGILLTAGMSINFSMIIGLAYEMGQKAERLEAVSSRTKAAEAMIMATRERMDDKIDFLIKAVARIEGELGKK